MEKWIYLLLFFLGLLFLPLQLSVRFYREPNKIIINYWIRLWFITVRSSLINPWTRFFWNLSRNRFWKKKPPDDLRAKEINWRRLIYRVFGLKKVMLPILKAANNLFIKIAKPVRIKEIRLYTELGMQDAAVTAVLTGVVWSFIGVVYSRLSFVFNLKQTCSEIRVVPNFQKDNFMTVDYSCIVEFRLGHIIIIIYHLVRSAGEISRMIRRISQ